MVKEPRFCLTLPAWRRHGTRFESVLVCLRDPASVARSLQRRNRISIERAERLWLLHYERLLENARDLPVRDIYEVLGFLVVAFVRLGMDECVTDAVAGEVAAL